MDYLKQLRTYAFPGNTEFAGLVDKVGTAVKAAMAGHVDYSYSMDPTNGGSYNLTYSVTIGFNSKAMYLDKTYPEDHAAILNVIRGGTGTDPQSDPFFSQIVVDNGDVFDVFWTDPEYKPTNQESYRFDKNKDWCRWDATYKALYFDKLTGWSKWMLKNPGVPLNNPPLGDEGDHVRDLNYKD